ncbi:MAG TPA: dihydroxyacetone kinase subunit DhaL [Thermoleophilia bacterium]|nr:dihydroxyacetone kinase subunit DhaL [Thermoleophilia bacterium]
MSETIDAAGVEAWLRAFARAVAERRDELTALDAAIGDADHGINMDRGLQAVLGKLDERAAGDATGEAVGTLLKTVGMTLVSTVGGAAGPLYGTLFLRMATAAGHAPTLTLAEWSTAFAAGVAGVQARGKAEPGDKTMVDTLVPASAALEAAAAEGVPAAAALRRAAAAGQRGMVATIPLVARKGRASYLGGRSAGTQDPGATSSWLLLEAAAALAAAAEP